MPETICDARASSRRSGPHPPRSRRFAGAVDAVDAVVDGDTERVGVLGDVLVAEGSLLASGEVPGEHAASRAAAHSEATPVVIPVVIPVAALAAPLLLDPFAVPDITT